MPVVDGYELLRQVHVSKPVEPGEIIATVAQVAGR